MGDRDRSPPPDRPRRTRGIRGGAAARRRREAYIRFQESEGLTRDQIPIVHQGGTARPLGTGVHWTPESDGDSSEDLVVVDTPTFSLTDLQTVSLVPRSALYNPYLSSGSASSSSAGVPTRRVFASSSSGSRPSRRVVVDPYLRHPPPGWEVAGYQNLEIADSVPGAVLHPSVKAFVWYNQEGLAQTENQLPKLKGRALAFDWHQVLDTDRESRWNVNRVQRGGRIPERHIQTLIDLKHYIQELDSPVDLIVCSHIHESETNLQNLLHSVYVSELPVSLILVTTERTGPAGKFEAIKAVSQGQFALFDDNEEIIADFVSKNTPCAQVRKPKSRVVQGIHPSAVDWSISSEKLKQVAKTFIRFHSRAR